MTNSVERMVSEYGWGRIKFPCISQLEPLVDRGVVEAMKEYMANLDKVAAAAVRNAKLAWPNAATYMHSE